MIQYQKKALAERESQKYLLIFLKYYDIIKVGGVSVKDRIE